MPEKHTLPNSPSRTLLPKASSPEPINIEETKNISSKTTRPCISTACMPCRKRKSKCDGGSPVCRACSSVYRTAEICEYDPDQDLRRKGALRREIKELKAKDHSKAEIIHFLSNAPKAEAEDALQLLQSDPDLIHTATVDEIKAQLSVWNNISPEGIEDNLLDARTSHRALLGPEDDEDVNPMESFETAPGEWTTVTQDRKFLDELLHLYLAWCHPSHRLFCEEIFFRGLKQQKLEYCSPALINSVFALGCFFSERPEARADPNDPKSVGDHFFAESRRCLDQLRGVRLLTNLQTLALMTIFMGLKNREWDARGYATNMTDMLDDLGVYQLNTSELQWADEMEAKRITFWGCLNLETLWTFCKGRFSRINILAFENEKPATNPHRDALPWRPYGHPNLRSLHICSQRSTLNHYQCHLTAIVDGIQRAFYAPQERITSWKLEIHHGKLQDWLKNLPESLHIQHQGPTLPQVINLHISYHNTVILLFRPFLKVNFTQDRPPPRQICTESANALSSLLALLSQTYGLKKVGLFTAHHVLTAAIVHLYNVCNPNYLMVENRNNAEDCLIHAIHGLAEMKHVATTSLSGRCLRSITNLIHQWLKGNIPANISGALRNAKFDPNSMPSTPTQAEKAELIPDILAPVGDNIEKAQEQQGRLIFNAHPGAYTGMPHGFDGDFDYGIGSSNPPPADELRRMLQGDGFEVSGDHIFSMDVDSAQYMYSG